MAAPVCPSVCMLVMRGDRVTVADGPWMNRLPAEVLLSSSRCDHLSAAGRRWSVLRLWHPGTGHGRPVGEKPAESGQTRMLAPPLAGTWDDCSDL